MAAADELYFNRNLIQAVKARPMLYDFRRKDYKDAALKEKVWMNISEETGRSQQECTSRWRQLRDRYVREKRSERNEASMGKPKRVWRYMPLMEFLSTYVVHRSSSVETSTLLECLLSTETEMEMPIKSSPDKNEVSPETNCLTPKSECANDYPVSSGSPSDSLHASPPATTGPQMVFTHSLLQKKPHITTTLPLTTVTQMSAVPHTCLSQKSAPPPHHNQVSVLPKKKKMSADDNGTFELADNSTTKQFVTDSDEMFCLSLVEYFKEMNKLQKLELRTRILTNIQSYLCEIKK